jgi:hypothetical protein
MSQSFSGFNKRRAPKDLPFSDAVLKLKSSADTLQVILTNRPDPAASLGGF